MYIIVLNFNAVNVYFMKDSFSAVDFGFFVFSTMKGLLTPQLHNRSVRKIQTRKRKSSQPARYSQENSLNSYTGYSMAICLEGRGASFREVRDHVSSVNFEISCCVDVVSCILNIFCQKKSRRFCFPGMIKKRGNYEI